MMDSLPTSTSSTSSVTSAEGRGGGSSDYLNLGMFTQQSSGVSDSLLLGTGGNFSGGIGNGYGNDGSGAPVGAPTSFDINEFPSLGGGGSGGGNSGNGLAAALRQQQQLLAHQQMLQGASGSKSPNLYRLAMSGTNGGANFNMATEDFPALPGAPVGGGSTNGSITGAANSPLMLGGGGGATVGSPSGNVGFSSRGNALYSSDVDGSNNPLEGSGLLGGGLGALGSLTGPGSNPGTALGRQQQQQQQQQQQRSGNPSSSTTGAPSSGGGASSGAGSAVSGDFGLLGLLGVIRMTDQDRQSLALGSDLTLLGLNLNANEQLFSSFGGPWSENLTSKEPHYQLPMCYYMQPPALKTGHLSKFQLETLFYIFYALPKDVLQAYSAQELYTREWRYNGDVKLWFKLAGPADGVANSSSGAPQYLYFDIATWERRLFSGNIQTVTSGFLSDEDVRVKFPNS